MPGFKGKRKRGLTLTLYKKPFRYRLPVSPPRKRTKTSSSTPNLKFPSIRTPSLLKKNLFQFQNIYILSNRFPHLFGAIFLLKMTETSPQIYTSYILYDFSTYISLTYINIHLMLVVMNKLNTRCQLNCGHILKTGKALYIL